MRKTGRLLRSRSSAGGLPVVLTDVLCLLVLGLIVAGVLAGGRTDVDWKRAARQETPEERAVRLAGGGAESAAVRVRSAVDDDSYASALLESLYQRFMGASTEQKKKMLAGYGIDPHELRGRSRGQIIDLVSGHTGINRDVVQRFADRKGAGR